jgi:aspartyl protease family protein
MRKLLLLFFSICLWNTTALADPYWDGYDDAQNGFWKRSDNSEYLQGYEQGQSELEEETQDTDSVIHLTHIDKPVKSAEKPLRNQQVIIKANRYGNYQIKGKINNREVDFIIDTGASLVSLSKTTARKLHLKYSKLKPIQMQTASGTDRAYLTTVKKISIGNIVLYDVQAAISTHDFPRYPLLGMSFLNNLEFQHKNNTMILRKK